MVWGLLQRLDVFFYEPKIIYIVQKKMTYSSSCMDTYSSSVSTRSTKTGGARNQRQYKAGSRAGAAAGSVG
jgi:hypothetical protein